MHMYNFPNWSLNPIVACLCSIEATMSSILKFELKTKSPCDKTWQCDSACTSSHFHHNAFVMCVADVTDALFQSACR